MGLSAVTGARLHPRRVGFVVVAGMVVIGLIVGLSTRLDRSPPPPRLAPNCAQPALVLSSGSVTLPGGVSYTLVGPANASYVIESDPNSDVVLDPSLDVGPYVAGHRLASYPTLPGCKASGLLPSLWSAQHEIALFVNGRRVATLPLTVRPSPHR